MNIQEIDKWLDNEYGTSYTRLEELHDYFFEKYTDQKEEIERLNNIINELQKENEFLKLNNPEMNLEHFRIVDENKRKINNLRKHNKQLKSQLQQKENIIKEVREEIKKGIFIIPKDTDKLLRIIDNDIELKGDGSNE